MCLFASCAVPSPAPLHAPANPCSHAGGLLGSITPRGLLAGAQWEAAQQAAASTPRELMREAVDQELQEAAQEHGERVDYSRACARHNLAFLALLLTGIQRAEVGDDRKR